MGLFSDIWDWMKSKVKALIDAATATLKTWARGLIDGVRSFAEGVQATLGKAISSLRGAWDSFRTSTLPALWRAIENAGTWITQYISNIYNTVVQNISNVVNNITKYVTNVYNTTKQYITNVTGATTEWVMGYIAKIIPADFIRDPWGYLQAAFGKFIETWVLGVAKAFGEGLLEGEQGSNPGPRGPGRSFMLGFEEALKAEEEG